MSDNRFTEKLSAELRKEEKRLAQPAPKLAKKLREEIKDAAKKFREPGE